MSKKQDGKGSRTLIWIIRILIIVIFCLSVVITVNRLAEWNRKNEEKERLEDEIENAGEE